MKLSAIEPSSTGYDLRTFTCPQCRRVQRHLIESAVTDAWLHDIRGTTVTLLAESGCTLPEIVSITGHSLRTAQTIIEKYLARTSKLAASAIAKFENVLETDFAKRPAKR